ncbi:hypothetical protein GJ496_001657 [Pomphorhynchus laevis]|nr:hypothetical protein GJ496_001657 [Pomphorhynchus laevis]
MRYFYNHKCFSYITIEEKSVETTLFENNKFKQVVCKRQAVACDKITSTMFHVFALFIITITYLNAEEEYPVIAHYRRQLNDNLIRIRRSYDWRSDNNPGPRRFEPGRANYLDIYIYAPSKHTVKSAGESVHFDCELTQGYDASWSRENGMDLSKYAETKKLINRNIYRIDLENLDESDSGRYVCAANTGNPSDVESVFLEVRGRYIDQYDRQQPMVDPSTAWDASQHQQHYISDDRQVDFNDVESRDAEVHWSGRESPHSESGQQAVDSQDSYYTDSYYKRNEDAGQHQNDQNDYMVNDQYVTDETEENDITEINEMDAVHPYYQRSSTPDSNTWEDNPVVFDEYNNVEGDAALQDETGQFTDNQNESNDAAITNDLYTDYVYDYLMDD